VDLTRNAQFISEEFLKDEGVETSAYFVVDHEDIGPTEREWWGGSRTTVTVPLESTCLAQGQTVTATMKAQQKACNSIFQMNAGRLKDFCPHSLVLQLDDSTANPWLEDPSLASCEFHTAPNAPVRFTLHGWHVKGEMGELLLTFTVTTMPAHSGALVETWFDIPGSYISDLTSSPAYPDSPNTTHVVDILEAEPSRGSDFGTRMRAFVVPPVTGDYTFWIATDDYGELWLSPDTDPANRALIASVSGWVSYRSWDQKTSQKSVTQSLVKGKSYYIEALQKEGGGGDHLSVAWEGGGISRSVVDGIHTRRYRSTNTAPVAVADAETTTQDQAVQIDVLANDYDAEFDQLMIVSYGQGANGGIVGENGDGTLQYTPPASYTGDDSFTYTVGDGFGGESDATVSVTVLGSSRRLRKRNVP